MEGIEWIANNLNFNNRKVKIGLVIGTILLLAQDTLIVYFSSNGNELDSSEFRNGITQMICHCVMWLIICMWIYAAPKFKQGFEKLEFVLYEISGVIKERPLCRTGYKQEESRQIWRKQLAYSKVFVDNDVDSRLTQSLKWFYFAVWIVMTILSSFYIPCCMLKHIEEDYIGVITIAFALISLFMCMFSWWGCMEYGYFLSRVSKMKSLELNRGNTILLFRDRDGKEHIETVYNPYLGINVEDEIDISQYYFNPIRPSQTQALRYMLFDSTMTSVAFLLVSGLYSIQYLCAMVLDNGRLNSPWEIAWMLLVLIPGIISLFPVVICPKLFILRIHRKWKNILIRDYQEKLQECFYKTQEGERSISALREEREYWTNLINTVSKDRLDVRYTEIIFAVLSVALDVGIIIATAA